ncbi:MAG: hypothetical protein HQ567_11005 [Candidatus Nealsonbacteria bacterium]|nr:hypothetical protein [Candidatus Nealsonbacteria bacterium]
MNDKRIQVSIRDYEDYRELDEDFEAVRGEMLDKLWRCRSNSEFPGKLSWSLADLEAWRRLSDPELRCQLFTCRDLSKPLSDEEWDAFRKANHGHWSTKVIEKLREILEHCRSGTTERWRELPEGDLKEQWDVFPGGAMCIRYFDTCSAERLKSKVATFIDYAKQTGDIVRQFEKRNLPKELSLRLPECVQQPQIACLPSQYFLLAATANTRISFHRCRKGFELPVVGLGEEAQLDVTTNYGLCWTTSRATSTWFPRLKGVFIETCRDGTTPTWDPEEKKLWLGPLLIRHYLRTPKHQGVVLSEFQEEQWRSCIDDPLPYTKDDPIMRVKYTVRSMNDKHETPGYIKFGETDNGTKFTWTLLKEPPKPGAESPSS